MGKLEEKSAFVTGAGGGIGRAIAQAFAQENARVGVADVNAELARQTAAALEGGRGTALVCDVANRRAVFTAMEEFMGTGGGLDILVNNAVFFHYAPLVDMAESIVDRMIDVGIKRRALVAAGGDAASDRARRRLCDQSLLRRGLLRDQERRRL